MVDFVRQSLQERTADVAQRYNIEAQKGNIVGAITLKMKAVSVDPGLSPCLALAAFAGTCGAAQNLQGVC